MYLHAKSYHPESTKKAIPYSQSLRLKRICSDDSDYDENNKILLSKLAERGYQLEDTKRNTDKTQVLKREELLKYTEKTPRNNIPFITTYNRQIPNIKKIVDSSWNTLMINPDIATKFPQKPFFCYRRNRNLKDLLGQTRISKNKVVKIKEKLIGKCSPCLSRPDTKCCKHIVSTSSFQNRTSKRQYKIFHNVSCESKNVIYLVYCKLCNNKPYVGKCEEQMIHTRITKHRFDAKNPKSIPVDRHFLSPGHKLDRDFKLIIIEEISNPNMSKEKIRVTLMRREDFWILKLDTLQPNGFNEDLNYPFT